MSLANAARLWLVIACVALVTTRVASADEPASQAELKHRIAIESEGIEGADVSATRRARKNIKQLAGRTIRAVSVEVTGELWPHKPELESVKAGDTLNAAVARRALRELLDSGAFAQAYADARPFEHGVVLRLVVLPRRLIASMRVEGGILDIDATIVASGAREGEEITEPGLAAVRAGVQTFYRRFGYDGARVMVETSETDDPLAVVLTIKIKPNEPRIISQRVFVVEPKFDAVLGELKSEYDVGAGDQVNEDALIEADNNMTEELRANGFLRVSVKHRILRHGANTYLYVYLDTGPRYQFRFDGNQAFDDSELLDALELDKSSEAQVEDLAAKLTRFYQQRGFLDANAQGSELGGDADAIHIMRFQLEERHQVQVSGRLFACLPRDAAKGVTAAELGQELDAVLAEELPDLPLLHAVDENTVNQILDGTEGGHRATPRRLAPALTYVPETYAKALDHLEKYLNSKGYLNAIVGPVSVIRAECDPAARGAPCQTFSLPRLPAPTCAMDALNLPVAEPALPEELECKPDPLHSVRCAPEMSLHIPVLLGPRTGLYDIVFEGNEDVPSRKLMQIAAFPLGTAFSQVKLTAASVRLLNYYRDLGYGYATVHAHAEESPDKTRARARFVINEHEPVVISEYEVRGAVRTDRDVIINRLALCQDLSACRDEEKYFRRGLVRESEEQIATLGPFSSVTIALEDPEIPQTRKRVIITVVEQRSQYVEPRGGMSTGEGFRGAFEYGHRNVAGQAIAFTLRLEFALLPDFLIFDDEVRQRYDELLFSERLERRNSASLRLPDIGLGPKVDVVVDGIDVRDNQRDYGLTREALIPTLNYRPSRQWTFQLGTSAERNNVNVFEANSVEQAIIKNPSLANLLRVPDGTTLALSQRLGASWDRRDNPFAATRGTFVSLSVEHVSALPLDDTSQITSEFIKLSGRGAGYVRLDNRGMALAISIGTGVNLQLNSDSKTYPDRLFYMGGVSTVRGFSLDAMVPEDLAQQVLRGEVNIDDVAVRGGDLFINPRIELRAPLSDGVSVRLFLDTGNVWHDIDSIKEVEDLLALRYSSGGGIGFDTPVGPLAFDYGIKLVRRDWEDFGAFHFSIGLF